MLERSSGILMHITSLPSPYGIGTAGRDAFEFAGFLKAAGQKYWQILPVNPTGFADSPYQSFSTFAGNPYLIDLDALNREGLIETDDYVYRDWGTDPEKVDYGKVFTNKFLVLRKAAERARYIEDKGFESFCEENGWWLSDYALFMAIKEANGMAAFTEWEDAGLMRHEAASLEKFERSFEFEVKFWKYVQYWFFAQWAGLKEYVNGEGLRFIGDIPIYVAGDSADVWANRELFCFDGDEQLFCAGVPPDYFSSDGQLWGNPIYRWSAMQKDGYAWWTDRLKYLEKLYDVIRIDHFRGFESYYKIPMGAETAKEGVWEKGPAMDFMNVVKNRIGDFPIIAEDLGFLTDEVHEMRAMTGYPGMKVLEFAFDSRGESDYLPYKYRNNCVVYTGTHDNNTLLGWLSEADPKDAAFAAEYAGLTKEEGYDWGLIRLMYSSVADLAVAQMQDLLGLGSEARMNTPATIGDNWCWRAKKGYATDELIDKIGRMVKVYGR